MKFRLLMALTLACVAITVGAQTRSRTRAPEHGAAKAPSVAELKTTLHAFLDRSLGWQGLDSMTIESISAPDGSGLRTAKVLLTKGTARQEATYYITRDGREIVEGQKSTLSADPWAGVRAKIDTRGAPVDGAADAPVTVVEFSDLECPYCKEEAGTISQLMQSDPGKMRVIFKFYPLTKIHPWSMQAAIAGACVARQGSAKFWKFAGTVFAEQDDINPISAGEKLEEAAAQAGVSPASYESCIASPSAKQEVEASIANGNSLGVNSTPTLFIDGRMVPGAVQESQLKLLVDHEATFQNRSATAMAGSPSGPQCGGGCGSLPPLPAKR